MALMKVCRCFHSLDSAFLHFIATGSQMKIGVHAAYCISLGPQGKDISSLVDMTWHLCTLDLFWGISIGVNAADPISFTP